MGRKDIEIKNRVCGKDSIPFVDLKKNDIFNQKILLFNSSLERNVKKVLGAGARLVGGGQGGKAD